MTSANKAYGLFATTAALLWLAACATSPDASKPVQGEVAQLNIMTMPVGLNFDDQPGVDGFSVKVYANDATNPKTVPINRGQIEVVIWDGSLFGLTNVPPALRTWTFNASQLSQHRFESGIGVGYEFSLLWGANQPTKRLITVAARYTGPDGRLVTSQPSSVTVIDL